MLHLVIERTLPTVISLCELMGIFVVAVSALGGFFQYCRGLITHGGQHQGRPGQWVGYQLGVQDGRRDPQNRAGPGPERASVLGAVILLRALLSLLIHFEMRGGG